MESVQHIIKLDWGIMKGPATLVKTMGPYLTPAAAARAADNFNNMYRGSGASAVATTLTE